VAESSEAAPIYRNPRVVVAGIAALCAVLFVAQNGERVEMKFLVFEVSSRLWVGFVVSLVLGALLGQVVGALRRRGDEG
jgi:uncharacterized integral membrane protein